MAEIGRRSAHLLISGLEAGGFDDIESESLPTELIVRGSTGPAPR
jgi:LacI family transcriptional regulator